MPRNIWLCEKCGSEHEKECGAQACEDAHPSADEIEITAVSYRSGRRAGIPETITIRYGRGVNGLATYRVDSY